GLAHRRAAGGPGFLADHAVLAPHLVAERAVERGLEILERHGGKLLLGDLGGFVRIGVEEFQSLHHAFDESAHDIRLFLNRIESHVDGGIGVGAELPGYVEERLAPEILADALPDPGLASVANYCLPPPVRRAGCLSS